MSRTLLQACSGKQEEPPWTEGVPETPLQPSLTSTPAHTPLSDGWDIKDIKHTTKMDNVILLITITYAFTIYTYIYIILKKC